MLVFIQLQHLLERDPLLFEKICLFFRVTFQSGNKVYSWGPLIHELEQAPAYGIFSFPLRCEIINLQNEFRT